MSWDPSLGRPLKREWSWNPFQELPTVFRARRAARYGAMSAGVLAGVHALYALRYAYHRRPVNTWVSHDPAALSCLDLALCATAVALGFVVYRRGSVWAATTVLLWAIIETQRWFTGALYGHVATGLLPYFSLMVAVLGFRGALALRRLSASAPPAASEPPM
ncbi:hypothetical protein [Phenylobacterium sp.]|uniref:hypothetical protein n=1 Tax=Phenylobacterium sp. TaxID=1871053 RepID=UPI0035ADC07C